MIKHGVDVTNYRLTDLSSISDLSKPFYDWVANQAQTVLSSTASFDDIIKTATESEIAKVIVACYDSKGTNVPRLFDGGRQPYDHHKACYYFFSWLIRDMPAQRLRPLISQVVKNSHQKRIAIEIEVLA